MELVSELESFDDTSPGYTTNTTKTTTRTKAKATPAIAQAKQPLRFGGTGPTGD